MSYSIRYLPEEICFALVAAHNQLQTDAIGSSFHRDRTCSSGRTDYRTFAPTRVTISATNASDLATSLVLVNQIKSVVNTHFADAAAHSTGTLSAAVTTADATDLATAQTLANALKAAYNTHRTASNVHFNNDSTNVVTSADASDQSTLNTLVNEMKTDINAHMLSAPNGVFIQLVSA